MDNVTAETTERDSFIQGVRDFADWIEQRPWVPVRSHSFRMQVNLHDANGVDEVRELGARLGEKVRDDQYDRTEVELVVGSVEYNVIAWHRDGRPGLLAAKDTELAELRAEVARLAKLTADNGLDYSREADDPTPVSPARGLHVIEPLSQIAEDGHKLGDTTRPRCTRKCRNQLLLGGIDHLASCPVAHAETRPQCSPDCGRDSEAEWRHADDCPVAAQAEAQR